jgi:hypothetical protein
MRAEGADDHYRHPQALGAGASGTTALAPQQPALAAGSQQEACSDLEQQGSGIDSRRWFSWELRGVAGWVTFPPSSLRATF